MVQCFHVQSETIHVSSPFKIHFVWTDKTLFPKLGHVSEENLVTYIRARSYRFGHMWITCGAGSFPAVLEAAQDLQRRFDGSVRVL